MDEQARHALAQQRLTELDAQSVPFFYARQTMLSEGFTSTEITNGAYLFHHAHEPAETVDQSEKLNAYLKASPEAAVKLAEAFATLDAAKDNDRLGTIAEFGKHLMLNAPVMAMTIGPSL